MPGFRHGIAPPRRGARLDAAVASYDEALAIGADYADAHYSRATIQGALGRYESAIASYDAAAALRPAIRFLRKDRLAAKMQICDWRDFGAELAALRTGVESDAPIANPFCLLGVCDSAELQARAARIYARELFPPDGFLGPIPRRERHQKIRIAYVSPDFRMHPIAALMAEVFERHDRERFEIIALSTGGDTGDEGRRRLERAFDRFIDVRGMSDQAVALLARRLGVDIAVDLAGFTTDCRARIFALRAALPLFRKDYLPAELSGQRLDPHDIEPGFFACGAAVAAGRVRLLLLRCCYKITPDVFAGWLRILRRVETSVLWLHTTTAAAARNRRSAACGAGIDPGRLVFGDQLPMPDYLARERVAANRLVAALFDSARFTRALETAYTIIYERHLAGLPPEHIQVGTAT